MDAGKDSSPLLTPPATPVASSDRNNTTFDLVTFQVEGEPIPVRRIQFFRAGCFDTMRCRIFHDDKRGHDVIELIGVSKRDFEALVAVLYPLPFFSDEPELTDEDWVSVLRLSSEWGIIKIRKLALEAIFARNMPGFAQIYLGSTFYAPSLVQAGTLQFIQQKDAITMAEAESLGIVALYPILAARDKCLRRQVCKSISRSAHARSITIVAKSVQNEFKDSLDNLQGQQDPEGVSLLIFARECGVKSWIEAAYEKLVEREKFLSFEEAKKLGVRDTVRVSRAREAVYSSLGETAAPQGKRSIARVDYKAAMLKAFTSMGESK